MSFTNKFKRAWKAGKIEFKKPESHVKGDVFEDHVRQVMFPKDRYDLIYRTPSYNQSVDDYAEATMYPDFRLRCTESDQQFYVEAKYRSKTFGEKLNICSSRNQLERYQSIDEEELPVVIALGLGGTPKQPAQSFLIPVREVVYTDLFESVYDEYSFYVSKPVFNGFLWNTVFGKKNNSYLYR